MSEQTNSGTISRVTRSSTRAPSRRKATNTVEASSLTTSPSDHLSEATPDQQANAPKPRQPRAKASVSKTKQQTPSADSINLICQHIADLQKKRIFCIVSQSRIDRAMQSAIARCLGYDANADEAARKAVFKQAGAIIKAVEAGKKPDLPDDAFQRESLAMFLPLIPISAMSRSVWDDTRKDVEAEMRDAVKKLPVCFWVLANARGVGELGLARIIGEATASDRNADPPTIRTIGHYATHQKLWKRMGVAVIGEERQQRKTDKVEAMFHGYVPRRRAELWSVCSDTMFRQQWRGADPDDPDAVGNPIGAYGEVYRHRKAITMERVASTDTLAYNDRRKWTRKRCDNDARRVMSKEFLRDLWRVWRGLEAEHPARWAAIKQAAE